MDLISAKYLLTMDAEPVADGAIVVENETILDTGKKSDLLAEYRIDKQENYPESILMPGLINAHTHLDMTFHRNYPYDPVRSIAIEVSFVDWLLSCIDYKKQTTADRLREAIKEGIDTSIDSGTTCVGDMGSYEGIFQNLAESGLRGVIFPEVLRTDSWMTQDKFETALALLEKYGTESSELVTVGLGPYSAYTLSRNLLKVTAQHAKSAKLPLMIHAAESFSEMEFFYNSSGDMATRLFPNLGWGKNLPPPFHKTPVAYLDDIDFLSAQPILVGCVNLTPDDMGRLAKNNAKVVWCPRSNHYLKQSVAPVGDLSTKGIPVALGTDGISSTNTLSLWDELRFAYELSVSNRVNLSARDLLEMVTADAAKVLGIGDHVGTLTKGKKADYLIISAKNYADSADLYSFLIQNTHSHHVQKVAVNGRALKKDS